MKLLRYTKIENDELYDKCKVDYREMKRDVLANRYQFGEHSST